MQILLNNDVVFGFACMGGFEHETMPMGEGVRVSEGSVSVELGCFFRTANGTRVAPFSFADPQESSTANFNQALAVGSDSSGAILYPINLQYGKLCVR
jgi:hypothetical protein